MRFVLPLALILVPVPAIAADKPRTPTVDLVPPDEVVRIVDAAMAELLAPGAPAVANWEKQGVDLVGRIATAPGGIDQTATIAAAAGDRAVDHYGNGALPVLPDVEPLVDLPARPSSGEIVWQSVSELGDGLWLRTSARLTQRGNAVCGRGWETLTILAPTGSPVGEDMRMAVMVVRLMAERIADIELCTIAFEQPDGSLIERSFLADGRPLPKMDERAKPIRIRPLADAAAILNP